MISSKLFLKYIHTCLNLIHLWYEASDTHVDELYFYQAINMGISHSFFKMSIRLCEYDLKLSFP